MNSRIPLTNTKSTYPTSRSVVFVINDNVVSGIMDIYEITAWVIVNLHNLNRLIKAVPVA
jgi:hypothetical protein